MSRTKFESDINWAKNNKRLTDIKIELNKLKDKAFIVTGKISSNSSKQYYP